MRICFFLASNVRSGANLTMLRHASFCAGAGHTVSVILQHRFFEKRLTFLPGGDALAVWFLDEWPSNATRQDVVVTNWWQCAFDMPKIAARRYAYYRHGDEVRLYQSRAFDALIDTVLRESFVWFAVSAVLAAELKEVGHQPVLLPNGVDLARFTASAPMLPPKQTALRVLVEGPVSSGSKRVDATIAAIRSVVGVEIVHMAADDSRPHLAVKYALGALSHDETAGVYASCDLIVKLSDAVETFAMPVLEQFAAGGTAIVTAFPGHDQYINASNAIIVDIAEPFAIAAAAVAMLRDDPALLGSLRVSAAATARQFNWVPLHQRFLSVLDDALSDCSDDVQLLPIIARYMPCHDAVFALWAANELSRSAPSE